ncbi:MAG: hypothetical protein PHP26_05570 [Syntrophomonas sp.]|nr:hypothetical protein [Syntrophomonas sp.]MDD3879445.1 hypothetical protein [Syntrophomonas sp.]
MNRRNWLPAIGLGLLGFVLGGLAGSILQPTPGYIPPLKVVGDVARVLKLEDPEQLGKLQHISYDGHEYKAIKLMDIITAAQPVAPPEQIYLVGSDGFTSSFPAEGLEKSYIAFTAQNAWEAINLNHPVNSNAKMLKEIVIVSEGSSPNGLTLINSEKELASVTPGQLYTRTLLEYPYAEGQAAIEKQGKTYSTSVYTQRKVFRLADLTPVPDGEMMLVMGAGGEQRFLENRGYFELKDNYINYLDFDERRQLEKVKGVIVNPPATSIMDIYYDARHYLENGEKVLVLVLDGLTYSLYKDALERGLMPFLKDSAPAVKAVGVYPLESNVWLAAMISGAAPEENGVVSEKQRDLKMPSLLALAKQGQKQALLLHAGPKLLSSEMEAEVTGKNANKTADKELYAITLDKLEQDYDLLIVRFQDIASSSELYGDEAEATISAMAMTDKYLQEIVKNWAGKVIITGSPGSAAQEFTCDTMFVPYLCLK